MKRNFLLLCIFTVCFICFAKSVPEPAWFKNYRNVYPNSEYLAQRGSGKTAEAAKTDAAAQLARYFQSTVNANISTTMTSITEGSAIREEIKVIDEVSVSSEVEFIGLEFTESWYYKSEKKWYAVAYMIREDAWIQYKPKIEAEKTKFNGFYKKAEVEEDIFTKIALYKSAWKSSFDYLEKLEYGRIINPKEEEKYSEEREKISELPSKIELEQKKLTLSVLISGDYGTIIETSVKNAFEKGGFIVATSGNYIADVKIFSNSTGQNPITVIPSVIMTIKSVSGKSIFSYQANLTEKTIAYTLENAQKKSFPKLAEKINNEIKF